MIVEITDKTFWRKKVEQSKTRCQISNQMLLTTPKRLRKHSVAPQVFLRSILPWVHITTRTSVALCGWAQRGEGGTSVGTEGVFDAVFWSAVTQKHRLCRERWPVLLATFFTRARRGAENHHHLARSGPLRLAIALLFFFESCMVSAEC